eukprot:CAMPEP_0172568884 /NCGR_PEP_ID=MMETSP1067-20121228/121446_1 /TAXON_ID=265564 ORGANISM="Thalassiosira punctigera, Strain Tpunct2005C2" /NCGR_SAMPLE_ID=MMETSP1067 /ASSEMBLY_ACC=CAM_ASM_000444 /LENGTH=404 /DNA_ID=CAMNT_0013360595 /DNA_START=156 /DNA_END=1369 /DNA_ORIENTATION=+
MPGIRIMVHISHSSSGSMLLSSTTSSNIRERDIHHPTRRLLSSAGLSDVSTEPVGKDKRGRRVWKAGRGSGHSGISNNEDGCVVHQTQDDHWDAAVDDVNDPRVLDESLGRICEQEREGGRMKQSQLGVLREDPHEDMRMMVENYTAAALASALRDREDVLQHCATLLAHNQLDELSKILRPYEQKYIHQRRHTKEKLLDFRHGGFDTHSIELLRRGLNRMPRRVSTAHSKRAGVVLPLCNVDGIPCILFEKRSRQLRAHPDEVCLPGGMVSEGGDKSIVQTCLREMEEEIGIGHNATTVLGVLRCNWGEVHHLVGVAVTPVVCFLGEIGESQLNPNPSEVSECFTVPLQSFLDRDRWVHKKHYAPFFTGGPHIIWGLTGYIVNRFIMDIIERYDAVFHYDNQQ